MHVYDALERYPDVLDSYSGPPLHCSDGDICKYLVVEIGDITNASLPQVLLSGAVHGDERPGPIAVVETLRLICEGVTGLDFSDRTVIIVPTANAWGYDQINRTEIGKDPNRDFPYNKDPSISLQTIAARIIDRVFSSARNVQSGITFHAGVSSITYPWGSPNHMGDAAPDTAAMELIAEDLRERSGYSKYDVGDMNTVVYPVDGGMEDWAYSLGFEESEYCPVVGISLAPICSLSLPSASIFLVEASDNKSVDSAQMGSRDDVWDYAKNNAGLELIPRLIRMSLRVIDLVKPRALVIPMSMDGKIPVQVSGCQEVSSLRVFCETVESADSPYGPVTCDEGSLILITSPSGCIHMAIHIVFDSHWKSDSGHLKYTQGRESTLSVDPASLPAGTCAIFENGEPNLNTHACLSTQHLYIHPGFIRYKPNVMVGDSTIATNITTTLTETSLSSTDIFPGQLITIESSFDPSVKFTATVATNNSKDDSSNTLILALLLSLLVPATLLTVYAIVRRKHKEPYVSVAAASPRELLPTGVQNA